MKLHLKRKHQICTVNTSKVARNDESSNFEQLKSMEVEIARMAAVDGFAFNAIANSEFMQSNLAKTADQYDKPPPVSCNGVKTLVMNFHELKKHQLKLQLGEKLSQELRFSLTLDEYTSIQNKRYLNINIHEDIAYWSLGLLEINGAFGSNQCAEVVKSCLNDFGLDLEKNIAGCTTDGASMMVKFGRENFFVHQQCIAHAIHLAVVDTFYDKKRDRNVAQGSIESVVADNSDSSNEENTSETIRNY